MLMQEHLLVLLIFYHPHGLYSLQLKTGFTGTNFFLAKYT